MGSALAFIAYLEDLERRGVHEVPDGSNCCEVCSEFGTINGIRCYAWCAATVSNGLARAGVPHKKSASVGLLMQSAKAGEFGAIWLPRDATVRVGDSPCYATNPSFWGTYHINTVTNPMTQTVFEALGGNQSNRVSRNHYGRSTVMGFIRWPFDGAILPAPTPVTPPSTPPPPADRMGGFPLPANHWFGTFKLTVAANHSGRSNAGDRAAINRAMERLVERGWRNVPRNVSEYTTAVADIVGKYQQDAHLRVDGALGAVTWNSMRSSPVR